MDSIELSHESVTQPRRKRYAPRSRKGCLTCRSRRKRCDEVHPHCHNCLRLGAECHWPERSGLLSHPNQRMRDPKPQIVQNGIFDLEPDTVHIEQSRTEAASRNDLTNKLNRPSSMSISELPIQGQLGLPVMTEMDRQLLTYYIQGLVPQICIIGQPDMQISNNYLITYYVPMAFQTRSLLWAILGQAAAHRFETTDISNSILREQFRELTKKYVRRCHVEINNAFLSDEVDAHSVSNATLATLLLLAAIEVQSGCAEQKNLWFCKIRTARTIIRARGGPKAFTNGTDWETFCLFKHFMHYEISSAITEDPESLHKLNVLPYFEWDEKNRDVAANEPSNTFLEELDPHMANFYSLFVLIYEVLRLSVMSSYSFARRYDELRRQILLWKPPPAAAGCSSGSLIQLAECYRHAALILLYRLSPAASSQRLDSALQILDTADLILEGIQEEAGLPFPLFMAGGELFQWSHIERCWTRLTKVKERFRKMNVARMEEILEVLWRRRLNNTEADWASILRENSWRALPIQ